MDGPDYLYESTIVPFPVVNGERECLDGAVEDGEGPVVPANHLTVDSDERRNWNKKDH